MDTERRVALVPTLLLSFVAVLHACNNSAETPESTTSGGTGNGGTGAIGQGGASTGGSALTGGSATGGVAYGGSATGGSPAGGKTTGGTPASGGSSSSGGTATTGGSTATGGSVSTGGTTTSGGTSSGGSSTGGLATGGSATGGFGTGGLSRGPTPPSSTSKFPFPQNRQSPNCIYPTAYLNEDVLAVYSAWKADLITSTGAGGFRRVERPAEPGLNKDSTVSEGIGYGMMISVYMDDKALFDDLWNYELLHTWTYTTTLPATSTPTILMNWYILADGTTATAATGGQSGIGAATDADEDMAWGLIMADRQWGGQPKGLSKTYLDYAKQLLGDIWKYEINQNRLPRNGSSWGDDTNLNISYFAPSHYRVFANASGESRWGTNVVDYIYTVIANNLNATNANQNNGLVPAFSQANGTVPAKVATGQNPLPATYQYDSCRTPFRIGLDACLFNEQRAKNYVAKTSQFFSNIGAAHIVDGYQLNGTPNPQFPSAYGGLSAAFIGPAGVGAMHSSTYQGFVDDVYGLIRQNNMWCGGQYYDESWTMLAMLMLTGNYLDYTKY